MSTFARGNQRPENALKRAEELGSKHQAFEFLSSIAVRKQKTWTKKLEELVLKFISLCVELNKPAKAKDALFAFRFVATQQPQSFENILRHFIQESERQAENVQSGLEDPLFKIVLDPALVNLIKSVSLDEHNRQADSEKVKPWLKFLWEAYRSVLEIIRNTPKLEQLYKETAKKAFDYCIKYGRVLEFRRLADLLRNHLVKHNIQYFESEESLAFHLEIRFGQLNTAVALELWQEAYKSIEDINNNLILPAKVPIPKESLLDYYRQLEKLYWVSKNYMFHTEALWKYTDLKVEVDEETVAKTEQTLDRSNAENVKEFEEFKNKCKEERETLYSRVVLSALSIPLNEKSEDPFTLTQDSQKEKEQRLAQLLGFDPHPNLSYLLSSIVANDILDQCHSNVKAIYLLFEKKSQLFQFANEVNNALNFLDQNDSFKQYKQPIFETSFIKLLQQLSGVYQTMQIAKLQSLVPNLSLQEIEKSIVLSHKAGTVDCRIDHRNGVLRFNMSNFETDEWKSKLINVSRNLRQILAKEQKAINQRIASNLQAERKRLLERQNEIERIKQQREQRSVQLAEAHALWRKHQEEKDKADLEKRQEQRKKEMDEKEKQRQQDSLNAQRKAQMVENLKKIASATGTSAAKKMADNITVTEVLDQEEFVKSQLERLVQERRKHERNLNQAAIRQDHWVRAVRELEKPLLESQVSKQVEEDKKVFLQRVEEEKKEHENRFNQQKEMKNLLLPVMPDWQKMKERIEKRAEEEYKAKAAKREQEIAKWREEKMKALVEEQEKRNARREQEKKREEERRQQEEARKATELENQRKVEEREREQSSRPWARQDGAPSPPSGDKPWSRSGASASTAPRADSNRPAFVGRQQASEPASAPTQERAWRRDAPSSGPEKPWARQGQIAEGSASPDSFRNRPTDSPSGSRPTGGDKPWSRTAGVTSTGPSTTAAPERPWKTESSRAGGNEGRSDASREEKPWSRVGGAGGEGRNDGPPSRGGDKPWSRGGAGGEGAGGEGAGGTGGAKPWQRQDEGSRGAGATGGKPWDRPSASSALAGATGRKPWDKPASEEGASPDTWKSQKR